MASLIYNLAFLVFQSSGKVPEPNNPPPPAPKLPIDDHIWILLVAGFAFGVYVIYKRNRAINKAS